MPEEQQPAAPEEETALTRPDAAPGEGADSEEVPLRFPVSVERVFSAALSGPLRNPLLDKLNAEHISSLISAADKDRDRALEDRKHSRKWLAVLVALIFIPIALLLGYFAFLQQNSLVIEIIKLVAVGAGGFFGGYGYGFARWRGRR